GRVQAGGRVEQLREAPVVRIELLAARMKFGTREPKFADRSLQLTDRELALPRIDAGEADEYVRVFVHRRGQLVVWIGRYTSGCLGVSAQQDRLDVKLAISLGRRFEVLHGPAAVENPFRVCEDAGPGT